MYLFVSTFLARLQRQLAASRRQAWAEGLAMAVLLAGVAAAWWYGASLAPPHQRALWSVLAAAAVVLSRRGWLKLFGPVLFYDLVRTGRRGRHLVPRLVYSGILSYLLLLIYTLTLSERGVFTGGLATVTLSPKAMAEFARGFFYLFMWLQILAVLMLAPAYTAGAIAAEKEQRTLEGLLATDLRGREIVLGIYLSRLANLAMVLLTGVPILCLVEFMGGLEPAVVLAGFAATGLTMASLGALGFLTSVRVRKARAAILWTYFWVLLYLVTASLSQAVLSAGLLPAGNLWAGDWGGAVTWDDVVQWLNAGNPLWALVEIAQGWQAGAGLDVLLAAALGPYAWFHGLAAVLFLGLATVRFRARSLEQTAALRGDRRPASRGSELPPVRVWPLTALVGPWPLLWKELVADTGRRPGLLRRLGFGLFAALVFLPAVHLLSWYGGFPLQDQWRGAVRAPLNFWVRGASVVIALLMLVQVAVRATGTISGERARRTLEGLLTTPLEANAILFAKWLGSIFNPRWWWVLLGLVWAWALYAGALYPGSVLPFVLAWLVYAAFLAGLGLYFSVISRSTGLGTIVTLLVAYLMVMVSWLAAFNFHWYGLVPPFVLTLLPSLHGGLQEVAEGADVTGLSVALGLLVWTFLALLAWVLASDRFRLATGRKRRQATQPAAVGGVAPAAPAPLPPGERLPSWTRKGTPFAWPVPRLSWLKRLRPSLPVALPLAVMLGWYGYRSWNAGQALRQTNAEIDRTDPGWRLEELEARRPSLPDDQNSALTVIAAARLIPKSDPDDNWRYYGLQELLPPDLPAWQQLSPTQTQALVDQLSKMKAAVAAARRLADLPQGRYVIAWEPDVLSTRLPHLETARVVAQLLGHDAVLRAQQGDADGAVISCRALVNAERSIGDEPLLISQLFRLALRRIAVRSIERTVAQGEPSEAALAILQCLIEEESLQPLLPIAIRGERASGDRLMEALQEGRMSVLDLLELTGGSGKGAGTWMTGPAVELLVSTPLPGQRAALLKYLTQVIEILELPPHRQDTPLGRLEATLPAQPRVVGLLTHPMGQFFERDRRLLAELRCTAVMLAVEQFRRKYQRWPNSLAELIPMQLAVVPVDPFDGQTLRYRVLPDGVVIYSVGPDRLDNGGTISLRDPLLAGDDVGVRLWDVDRRRRPPTGPVPAGPAQ